MTFRKTFGEAGGTFMGPTSSAYDDELTSQGILGECSSSR